MGAAGEARLRRRFSTDTMVDETIKLYERAVAER